MSLTAKERAFCGHYVANRGDAADAARKAGYSDKGNGAKVMGHRLLQKPAIQFELQRLTSVNTKQVNQMLTHAATSETYPDPLKQAIAERDVGVSIALERAYQQHALVKSTAMALGEMPRPLDIVVKDPKGLAAPKVYRMELVTADPRAAAYCAHLLGEELARLEEQPPAAPQIEGTLAQKTQSERAIEEMARKLGLPMSVPDDYDPTKE